MTLVAALTLQAGYNAALVAVGAAMLGFAAGAVGTFLTLRKRALVADALAHATLPGVALAFLAMVALGGDGRSLTGLLAGSALSAWLGLWLVEAMVRRTRLPEDAAIGAVLSVFFGAGVVLLTVIQGLSAGRQAGLEGFLLGSTAGMLWQDAVMIAAGGGVVLLATYVLRRPLTLLTFDAQQAAALGYDLRRLDLALMGLVMAVTVIGLKLVGLVLIVALLIIPAVTARLWSNRSGRMVWLSGGIGALSAYAGAAVSAVADDVPTGPVIVLIAAAVFAVSLLFAPERGIVAGVVRQARLRRSFS